MKVLITGAAGTIGSVLMHGLAVKYRLLGIDCKAGEGIERMDLCAKPQQVRDMLQDVNAVIHLAWDTRESGTGLGPILHENRVMIERVYAAAHEAGVRRVILASSVHVMFGHLFSSLPLDLTKLESLPLFATGERLGTNLYPHPLGTYGAAKVYGEMIGRVYAARGITTLAVRFGNVALNDIPAEPPFWLSHRDCVQFLDKCLTATNVPTFSPLYAVSNNVWNPFDLAEARTSIGFAPQDGTSELLPSCPL